MGSVIMDVVKSTVIIPVRNEFDMVKLAIKYAKQHQTVEHEYIILFDNPDETGKQELQTIQSMFPDIKCVPMTIDDGRKLMHELAPQYVKNVTDRVGIILMYTRGVQLTTTEYCFIIHSDMIPGPNWDREMFKHMGSMTTVCGTRIEPKTFGADKAKHHEDCGLYAHEFNEQKFLEACKKYSKDDVVPGLFAPHLFKKSEWVGYDMRFHPQSREELDQSITMVKKNILLKNSRSAMFYHFAARGSRRKDNPFTDSEEWKWTNYKNERNIVRKHRQGVMVNDYCHPIILDISKTMALGVMIKYDEPQDLIIEFLRKHEPYFDKVYVVIDSTKDTSLVQQAIALYKNKESIIETFDPNKIIVIEQPLERNFAKQRNILVDMNDCDWLLQLDTDEHIEPQYLNYFRDFQNYIDRTYPNAEVVGLPRVNIIDGQQTSAYPDYQFRFVRKGVQWRNTFPKLNAIPGCHEMPKNVHDNKESVVIVGQPHIIHPKTSGKQILQNKFYAAMSTTEKPKHVIYDSVIWTNEGITKHARYEIVEWMKRGFNVNILDQNFRKRYDHNELSKVYNNQKIDIEDDSYVTIVNQAPVRYMNTKHLKNRIGFLAFEGNINEHWVKEINQSGLIELWTPSNYCKNCFEESGVKIPIRVVPHGISPEYKRDTSIKKFEPFTFLWVGAPNAKRKNIEMVLQSFSETFKNNKNVQLVLKINTIYDPSYNIEKVVNLHVPQEMLSQIKFITDDLSEKELIELYNKSHVYVSTSYSEGFGMNILEALACGLPVITTQGTGNDDFTNKNNATLIENEDIDQWAPLIPPYEMAKWKKPKLLSCIEAMKYNYDNYDKLAKQSSAKAKNIHDQYSWERIVELMDHYISEIFQINDSSDQSFNN